MLSLLIRLFGWFFVFLKNLNVLNNRQARCVWLKSNVWTGYSDTVRWGLLYRQTNSLSFSKRAKQSFETAKQAPEENIQLFAMDVGEGGGQAQELSATHITVNAENY